MCQPRTVQLGMAACGCCGCGPSPRGLYSAEEELKDLKCRRDQLERELAGIRDRMDRLSKT